MEEAPTGDELLTPDDAVNVLEEIIEAQNKSYALGLKVLPQHVVESIHSTNPQPHDRLLQVLIEFTKQVDPRPTWRAIVAALRSPAVNLPQLAMRVEAAHFPHPRDTLPETSTESQLSVAEPTATDRDILQVQAAGQYIKDEIRQLEKRFNSMKKSTRECLERLRVPVKKVADTLTSLPADDVDEHKQFLESHLSALYQAPNHSELFGTMNFHWNYQNPQLLDHLIREFDLEGVKGEMKTYKENLQQFRKKTPLKLFCQSHRKKHIEPPPDFCRVVAEFDWPDDVTLEVVEEFRQEYADHYSLHKCAMMLDKVLPCGSFTITWFIPGCIVEKLKVKIPKSILKKYSVTKLEIDGEHIYPEIMNELDLPNLPKKMEAHLRGNPNLKQFLLSNDDVKRTGPRIGAGAYGIVEEVKFSGTICAAKVVRSFDVSPAESRRVSDQFVEECQLMSTLRHPNIVQFLGVCFFPGSQLPALIMERLQIDLHKFLDPTNDPRSPPGTSKPFFPLSSKCSILHNVASGLAYLHGRTPPIIHRDLSARNVLLASGMVAKIADLGVARILPDDLRAATMTMAPGTIIYMPPEALESDSKDHTRYGVSIDIFSFGVVAIFTLSETFPYKLLAPNYQEGDRHIPRTELDRRREYMKIIYSQLGKNHPLCKMIERCLDFPYKRPNIQEVLGLLEEARGEERDDQMETNNLEAMGALQIKSRDKKSSANSQQSPQLIHSAREKLTVRCHKKKKAPCVMSRGSATTDDQYAYFIPCSSNSVFRYNWSTENWDEITPCPHHDSGLVIIDGELTAVGGYDGSRPTNEIFTYTPQQKEWVNKHQPMKIARFQAAVVSTEDGKYVFAIGGQSDINTWTATVEVLDVKSGEWQEITHLTRALTLPSATIFGDQLRVIGGNGNGFWCSLQPLLFSIQPTTLEWREIHHLPINGSTAATLSQRLVIIGGDKPEEQGRISKWFSDPDVSAIHQLIDGQWVKIGAMSVTRSECLVVSSSPDELLIVGGVEERGVEKCVVVHKQ